MAHTVYIALGTNLGDRLENLRSAIGKLPPTVQVRACSSVYETPPWGLLEQPSFLNMAIKGVTDLHPAQLLAELKQIESSMGRVKSIRYGPRLIDLDILFYDNLIYEESGLVIPHPRLEERAFVLVPLEEIASFFRHPLSGFSVHELLQQVDISGIQLLCKMECGEKGIKLE